MHIEHPHGGELRKHAARGEPRGQRLQLLAEHHVQAIGEKRNEDVRLDAAFQLMKDRANGQIALEILGNFSE
jgi:hypothetical protein